MKLTNNEVELQEEKPGRGTDKWKMRNEQCEMENGKGKMKTPLTTRLNCRKEN
jgi:hypothetical protein